MESISLLDAKFLIFPPLPPQFGGVGWCSSRYGWFLLFSDTGKHPECFQDCDHFTTSACLSIPAAVSW